nr:hypothetical protein [Tanacetum cinerariifolium]
MCMQMVRFEWPVGGSSMWLNTPEEPPLSPFLRKMPASGKDGGDASPIVADPTIADLIVTDPIVAEPSVADPTGLETSYAGDTGFVNKDETVTEDPIEESQVDDIPT